MSRLLSELLAEHRKAIQNVREEAVLGHLLKDVVVPIEVMEAYIAAAEAGQDVTDKRHDPEDGTIVVERASIDALDDALNALHAVLERKFGGGE